MKTKVYDIKNNVVGEAELTDDVFARPWNPDLVHQVVVTKAANQRRPWSHAKTRAEVRGGGIKPWRQKGTGRARHGSRRSPIWKGGGVTFGPSKERDYSKKINKKMVKAALYSVLSKKLNDGELRVIDNLKLQTYKTKELNSVLKDLRATNALIIPRKEEKQIYRACSNIPKASCLAANSLNITDILKYKHLLIDSEAVKDVK